MILKRTYTAALACFVGIAIFAITMAVTTIESALMKAVIFLVILVSIAVVHDLIWNYFIRKKG